MELEGKTVVWPAGRMYKLPVFLLIISTLAMISGTVCIYFGIKQNITFVIYGCIILIVSGIAGWYSGFDLYKTKYALTNDDLILRRWKTVIAIHLSDIDKIEIVKKAPHKAVEFTVGPSEVSLYLKKGKCYTISCNDDRFINAVNERCGLPFPVPYGYTQKDKGSIVFNRPIVFGRGFAGSQALFSGIVMILCLAVAFFASGYSYDTASIGDIVKSCCDGTLYAQAAFGLGGMFLLMFGLSSIYANEKRLQIVMGYLFAISSVLMLVSAFVRFPALDQDVIWTSAFAFAALGSALYAYILKSKKHTVGAGFILAVLIPLIAASVFGAMEASFALAIATPLCLIAISSFEIMNVKL